MMLNIKTLGNIYCLFLICSPVFAEVRIDYLNTPKEMFKIVDHNPPVPISKKIETVVDEVKAFGKKALQKLDDLNKHAFDKEHPKTFDKPLYKKPPSAAPTPQEIEDDPEHRIIELSSFSKLNHDLYVSKNNDGNYQYKYSLKGSNTPCFYRPTPLKKALRGPDGFLLNITSFELKPGTTPTYRQIKSKEKCIKETLGSMNIEVYWLNGDDLEVHNKKNL